MTMNYFYEKYGVILARSEPWQIEKYGFPPEGLGDCIFRTALTAIAHYDHKLLDKCVSLLQERKRWPDLLDPPRRPIRQGYRRKNRMTRDPFIMTFCAMYLLTEGSTSHMRKLRVPWYINRPYLKNWVRYLLTTCDRYQSHKDCEKYLIRYERQLNRLIWWGSKTQDIKLWVEKRSWLRWTRHRFGIHGYSLHLWAWMVYTAGDGATLSSKVLQYVPHWNTLLWLLFAGSSPHFHFISGARRYRSKKGYQWTRENWIDKDYLPAGEKYYLDKDILDWVFKQVS